MNLIAITSCATGIAHTYMAAQAIQNVCKEHAINCRVELQGALGIEDRLSKDEIESADVIIFANDVRIKDEERFDGVRDRIKSFSPHDIIKNPKIILD